MCGSSPSASDPGHLPGGGLSRDGASFRAGLLTTWSRVGIPLPRPLYVVPWPSITTGCWTAPCCAAQARRRPHASAGARVAPAKVRALPAAPRRLRPRLRNRGSLVVPGWPGTGHPRAAPGLAAGRPRSLADEVMASIASGCRSAVCLARPRSGTRARISRDRGGDPGRAAPDAPGRRARNDRRRAGERERSWTGPTDHAGLQTPGDSRGRRLIDRSRGPQFPALLRERDALAPGRALDR
jgi:hypothetical protein